jgi:uncharacterized protein YndB with AHSA1/START domain
MTTSDVAVHKTLTVDVPAEKAFQLFTGRMGDWWLSSHHIGEADFDKVVIEPETGGRWYEVDAQGNECDWGHVIAWEPPTRVVLAWQLTAEFQFDPEFVTEVEVRFNAIDANRTTVELEHRNLDRYGDVQERVTQTFDSPGGWQGLLDSYASLANGG